jgi:hypothetical protein
VQKEIIVIIGGPEQEKYYYRWLAKGFVVTLKFPEVTLEAKTRYRAIISRKPLLFSELLLKEEKNNL